MPVVNTPTGRYNFPDGMSMEEMDAALQQAHPPQQQRGGFAGALQQAFFPSEQATPSIIPTYRAPGLSPENGQRLRDTLGQQKQFDASEQLRQRAQRERELEKEKDRAKDLSLEQQWYKNRQTEMQMKLDQDIALIEREEENGTIQIGSDGVARRVYKKKNPETGESQYTVETYGDPIVKPQTRRTQVVNGQLIDLDTGNLIKAVPQGAFTPSTFEQTRVSDMLNKSTLSDQEKVMAYEQWKATGSLPPLSMKDKDGRLVPMPGPNGPVWGTPTPGASVYERPRASADPRAVPLYEKAADAAGALKKLGLVGDDSDSEHIVSQLEKVGAITAEEAKQLRTEESGKPGWFADMLRGGLGMVGAVTTGQFGSASPQVTPTGEGYDDEASIPEGATVQDLQGRLSVKRNGKLVPVTGF